jgi:arabinogalactan oligomer / maltooligosaccharide transport system permease protein
MRHAVRLRSLGWHSLLVVIVLATIYPILQIFSISLRPSDALYSTSLNLIPENASFESYRVMLLEKPFWTWMRNSLLVAFATAIFGVTLASTSAYALSRFQLRGKNTMLFGILTTQMFPATMLLLPLYLLMRDLSLVNTLFGVVLAYTATALPFCTWTMKGYYDTIPRSLEEAGLVDGLSELGAFWRITLPLAAPALVITFLFSFLAGYAEFIVARTLLVSKQLYTLPLGLESLASTFQTEWANYAAGSLLVAIPVVVLFLALSRYLVEGLTLGGVKG